MYKTAYGPFNGDTWEDFCQQCFKLKYEAQSYMEMPAMHKGDLGIEGLTNDGVLFQCYCPDMEYNTKELYEKQRDKITEDLGKLITFKKELKPFLGSKKIKKWVFVTPEYTNKDLVRHCIQKSQEYRNIDSELFETDFEVVVNDIEFFSAQIPIVLKFRNDKIDILPIQTSTQEITDWKTKEITLVHNAIKKHTQRVPEGATNQEERINILTQQSISDFLNGDGMIRKWAEMFQDQFEKFQRVVDQFETKVVEKCALHDGENNQLYKEIEKELREKIKLSFEYLDETMIDRLTARVMADWILRCPIKFE